MKRRSGSGSKGDSIDVQLGFPTFALIGGSPQSRLRVAPMRRFVLRRYLQHIRANEPIVSPSRKHLGDVFIVQFYHR
jgi:hypothetical protein